MNSFYASVEIMRNPALRGKPVAVCGSENERHGIVLAKSIEAKRAGVKTGMTNREAKELCPGLIILPPDYSQYVRFSNCAREIYGRFTDYIEPFGMDECWLDVTDNAHGLQGQQIADKIRNTVHDELGLTVSVGVSWNKIFAKLGSDMKKPDATTVISRENFMEKVWPLPVSDLLYAGPATTKKLNRAGIRTIGDLAAADDIYIKKILGVNGLKLLYGARGEDSARVMHKDTVIPPKSVGHGVTCSRDLKSTAEVKQVILELSQDIGRRLREAGCLCSFVSLSIRLKDLSFTGAGTRLMQPVRSPLIISDTAFLIFASGFADKLPVRQVTVTASELVPSDGAVQQSLFIDQDYLSRLDRAEDAVYSLRKRFGKRAVIPLSLLKEDTVPFDGRDKVKMPSPMYR